MATSGSIDLASSRDIIIKEALEQLGVLAEGEDPTSDQLTSCVITLNNMTKAWQTKGLKLFAVQRVYLFLQLNVSEYLLSSSSAYHHTTSFVSTELSAAASDTDTTIDVDSITGISDGDYIGIKVDDGTMHWTTVDGAPSGSTVTLDDALDDDAAVDSTVYAYTTKANRPMRILSAHIRDTSGTDIPLGRLARSDYMDLSIKTTDGKVNQYYYDPQIGTGRLYLWPESSSSTDYLVMYVQRTLEDFDAGADEPDFPQEWFEALSFGLASRLLGKYGVQPVIAQYIRAQAAESLMDAIGFSSEEYIQLQPDHVGRY